MTETCELLLVSATVAANNQPRTEGQYGHRATQRQKISGVVQLEANSPFEHSDNQAHNNHIGEIVFQVLEAVHRENVCVLILATSSKVLDHQLIDAIAKDQQGDAVTK